MRAGLAFNLGESAMATFERLTALDTTFLGLEDGNAHMHVGGVLICEPGPLRLKDGRLDIGRIREAFAAKLHMVPRYRQRLSYVPYEHHPVWIDDDRFNIEYHLRMTALPKPGGPKRRACRNLAVSPRLNKRLKKRSSYEPVNRGTN